MSSASDPFLSDQVNYLAFPRQLKGPASAGGVEGHEQDAPHGGVARLLSAQNRRQVTCLFGIRSVSNAPGFAKNLDVEEAQRCQVLSYGVR